MTFTISTRTQKTRQIEIICPACKNKDITRIPYVGYFECPKCKEVFVGNSTPN